MMLSRAVFWADIGRRDGAGSFNGIDDDRRTKVRGPF
jgi:hypothetical protein